MKNLIFAENYVEVLNDRVTRFTLTKVRVFSLNLYQYHFVMSLSSGASSSTTCDVLDFPLMSTLDFGAILDDLDWMSARKLTFYKTMMKIYCLYLTVIGWCANSGGCLLILCKLWSCDWLRTLTPSVAPSCCVLSASLFWSWSVMIPSTRTGFTVWTFKCLHNMVGACAVETGPTDWCAVYTVTGGRCQTPSSV